MGSLMRAIGPAGTPLYAYSLRLDSIYPLNAHLCWVIVAVTFLLAAALSHFALPRKVYDLPREEAITKADANAIPVAME